MPYQTLRLAGPIESWQIELGSPASTVAAARFALSANGSEWMKMALAMLSFDGGGAVSCATTLGCIGCSGVSRVQDVTASITAAVRARRRENRANMMGLLRKRSCDQ